MKILHYALGFPPYRTGGLTKYCLDLMTFQAKAGNTAGLLWPGEINPFKRQAVKKRKNYQELESFEIINPLPVALDEGVRNPRLFMSGRDQGVFERFFQEYSPDVLHIHTLMGFSQEILKASKKLGIRTVFTTHDYYGICPKVTLFRHGAPCMEDHGCTDCVQCNQSGLSMKKIAVMQSPLYRALKDIKVVKYLRRQHRIKFFEESDSTPFKGADYAETELFRKLRSYYISILEAVDFIHFNSSVAEAVYRRYLTPKHAKVILISHCGIKDHRRIKNFTGEKLRLTYLAPAKPFKGYYLLKEVLDELWDSGNHRFELRIFSGADNPAPYMIVQNGYQYGELEEIFEKTDVLLAPSIWNETFGFTVLEALSFGVPVIVSERVGAKDLLNERTGIVCRPEKEELRKAVETLFCRDRLAEINRNIVRELRLPKLQDILYEAYKQEESQR